MSIRAPKDFWAGVMFIAFAAVALYAGAQLFARHRGRMGPGLFPDAAGRRARACIGAILVVRSFVIDGEPIAPLQVLPLAVVALAVVLFGVLLPALGLVVTLAIVIAVSALAGRQSRPLEVAAAGAVLAAFSVARVRLRPAAAAPALADVLEPHDGCLLLHRARLRRRADAAERSLLLPRRVARHGRRRAAGHRPGHHRRDAAADLVHARSGLRDDPAGRHLLRRAIRRLDHGDPGQHSGRSLLGHHHARRPPDGAAGPRRARARHRGDRLVLRRLRRDAADLLRRAAARRGRAASSARRNISR